MAFTCLNELEISGGSEEDRRAAAGLVLAVGCVDEAGASRRELPDSPGRGPSLLLRFESRDGLPEEDIAGLAPHFPALAFLLRYFSLDGEFYGYARAGAGGEAAESEDLFEDARELVGRRHDGDALAFVKERYGLA
jgi:hypothetical protein